MHAKRRNGKVLLYRSTYIRKGERGNTHGYAEQRFVGSMNVDAQTIPAELVGELTEVELLYVQQRVIEPAQKEAEARRVAEEARALDPSWRVDEAVRLLAEAVDKMGASSVAVDTNRMGALQKVVGVLIERAGMSTSSNSEPANPLKKALEAIKLAAAAVANGRCGRAPSENVRNTEQYQLWTEIKAAMEGDMGGSLLRALQDAGFVKAKIR
ncbi:hypothetical protein [Paraburkholderia sp. C35]|uniref:hypothetical protein n=1 Tax=Paraburkholderia sp. C35 TaxID=2126993 RepID=UPI000D69B63C|nr:hypothetical protein [Paraburkholderia sp. C35]